jgi:peptide/nickel transport system substrate-binding protein
MLTNKKFHILLAFMVVASLILAACAQPTPAPTQPPAQAQPTQPPAETEPPAAEPTTPPEPVKSDKYGGVLKQAYVAPTSLDPAFLSSIAEDQIGRQWGDFLVYTGEENQPDPYRSLAESWTTSPDGLTWTFNLRQGVQFNNGEPLTANDVKFSFDRLRDEAVGAATVPLYANIADITTPDEKTVVFTLTKPNADFLLDIGDYHALMIWSGIKDFNTEFIGTGPFMIDSYLPEDRMVFKRNPNYWMKDAEGNQLPYLDGMEFIFISESSARVEALLGGQVNYLLYLPGEYVKTLEADPNVVVYQKPSNLAYVIRMRSDRKPFDDNRVRQAFKAATDRAAILAAAGEGLGVTAPDTPFGPGYGDFFLGESAPERDIEKAKALLTEAGYPNGLTITLTTQQSSPVPAIATILKEQLAEAGITVEIQLMPPDVYYGADNTWMEADFAITDWGSRAYPQPYLDLAYTCNAKWNESHWCDAELDELAKQAATELDRAKRAELYHQIQRIFIERGPIIIPYFANGLWAASADLKGLVPTSYLGTAMDLRPAYFEK